MVQSFPLKYIVVFVDYQLRKESLRPEDRGDYVTTKIKEVNPDLPVVILSGDTSKEALNAWLKAGVDKFLYKPFKSHQVFALAEVALTSGQFYQPRPERRSVAD